MNARSVSILVVLGVSLALGASGIACSSADTGSGPGGSNDDGGAQSAADGSSQTSGDSATASNDGGNHCPGCGDGGGSHDAAAFDAADGGFGESCTSNASCPPEYPVCFNYSAKGMHCTKSCTTAADCPPTSGGCSGMGVCKIP